MVQFLSALWTIGNVPTDYGVEHLGDFVRKEGYGPAEQVYVPWKVEGMLYVLVLLNVHLVILNEYHCPFVAIGATVVRGTKHRDHTWKSCLPSPPVHFVTLYLHLMCSDDREKIVLFKESLYRFQAEFD